MGPRTRRSRRPAVAAALSALFVPIAAVAADTRAPGRTATAETGDPQPAARLVRGLRSALATGGRALHHAVRQASHGRVRTVCPLASRIRCDSGLGLRTLLVDTVMRRAENLRRGLEHWEHGGVRVSVRIADGSVGVVLAVGTPAAGTRQG